jgi:hypothetical protein
MIAPPAIIMIITYTLYAVPAKTPFALMTLLLPDLKLPAGYSQEHIEVVVEGVCKDCS